MSQARITEKTAVFLRHIASAPGITAAELHRRAGKYYAHGHHKFSYETVSRMLRNGLIAYVPAAKGLRGCGLAVTASGSAGLAGLDSHMNRG